MEAALQVVPTHLTLVGHQLVDDLVQQVLGLIPSAQLFAHVRKVQTLGEAREQPGQLLRCRLADVNEVTDGLFDGNVVGIMASKKDPLADLQADPERVVIGCFCLGGRSSV